jgi:exodeoxyribonuclease V alpha subunit
MQALTGTVDSIVYRSDGDDFTVFRLVPARENIPVSIVGNFPVPLVGEELELTGDWVEHSRFGRQFKAVSCRRMAPSTVKGIERFLASGAIKGIGPATAARMVARFGDRTLEMLEVYPHRLTEIEGIGAKKAAVIRASFAEHSDLREIMLFLETHGVTGAYAGRIYKHYGGAALAVLKDNPYRLAAEVDGIGFRSADHIATALGRDMSDPDRLTAGIEYALLQTAQTGHCCLPEETLVQESAKLLGAPAIDIAVCLAGLVRDNKLHTEDCQGTTLIYPGLLYHAETQVAARLKRLQERAFPARSGDAAQAVAAWEESEGVTLAAAQREAVAAALRHGVLVLTGGPGTGKTVTVKGILAVLAEQGFKILLGAPTGRAAKRLSEACGREAATIHRLLEATGGREGAPQFMRDERTPLDADVVIIDEASMIDITLMYYLLRAVPEGCRFVLVGDVDQLPAVGPGSVLKDIIRSGTVPVVRLSEVFRQAGESVIVVNAHRINRGLFPDIRSSADFQFREVADEGAVAAAVVKLCGEELPAAGLDPLADVQVLSPMHRQQCGVENLNRLLQAALNPPSPARPSVGVGALRLGDKVMQTRNNYGKGVFNGDIGYIVGADSGIAVVRYPDGDVLYEKAEIDELVLAYAMSVHKSQGSEYPAVVMPLVAGHYIMLQRNLLYTAVTRAKQRVILLGTKAALNTALANDRTRRRYSLLAERLRGEGMC